MALNARALRLRVDCSGSAREVRGESCVGVGSSQGGCGGCLIFTQRVVDLRTQGTRTSAERAVQEMGEGITRRLGGELEYTGLIWVRVSRRSG